MNLETLLQGFARATLQRLTAEQRATEVTSLTSSSREVLPGSVFFALPGATPGKSRDGFDFIPEAVMRGACLVVGERELTEEDEDRAGGPGLAAPGVPYVRVPIAAAALSQLASVFYGHPSRAMKIVGVTGTSGKTTSTYLLESILQEAGHRVGVIGTVNTRFPGQTLEATHTTPGPLEVQRLLARMRDEGRCTAVVMEVSSHALKQHRVAGVAFDAMVFTNLTPEHLDYHPTIEDYFQSKLLLFTAQVHASVVMGKRPAISINVDDEAGARILKLLGENPVQGRIFASFGIESADAMFSGRGLTIGPTGIRGRVFNVEIDSPLACRFNAYNILGAVSATLGLGVPPSAIERGVRALRIVPGRLERVEVESAAGGGDDDRRPVVYVDYAHKSDALRKVLEALVPLARDKGRRLIAVFGCGGDRDREKRPVMGRIAAELADLVWVTSDNPRTEDPQAIVDAIVAGIPSEVRGGKLRMELDRARAIDQAIASAAAGDVVLIAGKGHEDYQIVGAEKRPFDDRVQARAALAKWRSGAATVKTPR